jgi:uncharacterized damage-inducible protein DinB
MLNALMDHMEWADAAVWRAALKLGSADPRLHKLLLHLHSTQRAFLQVWRSAPLNLPSESKYPDLPSILAFGRTYYEEAKQVVANADEAQRTRLMPIQWADSYTARFNKKAVAATFEETVHQITTHSTYHRGQVNARIKELGGEPPPVDFIIWVWLQKPAAEWPG